MGRGMEKAPNGLLIKHLINLAVTISECVCSSLDLCLVSQKRQPNDLEVLLYFQMKKISIFKN